MTRTYKSVYHLEDPHILAFSDIASLPGDRNTSAISKMKKNWMLVLGSKILLNSPSKDLKNELAKMSRFLESSWNLIRHPSTGQLQMNSSKAHGRLRPAFPPFGDGFDRNFHCQWTSMTYVTLDLRFTYQRKPQRNESSNILITREKAPQNWSIQGLCSMCLYP